MGDDLIFSIVVSNADESPADLSDAVAQAQIRETFRAPVEAELDTAIENNIIALHLRNDESAHLPLRGVWDCQLVFGGIFIRTILMGSVNVTPDVTRYDL